MLHLQNLTKVFNKNTVNENKLFTNLNLLVNKGDFITIIGSNGAGKSTLLNLIAGTYLCDEGNLLLHDHDITLFPEYKRTRKIGRVYQDPKKGTSPSLTVLENLSLAYNKGKSYNLSFLVAKKKEEFFVERLKQLNMGLEDKLHTKVGLLSGGQRQAISIIMATLSDPDLLLLDEPTAALDPKASERIIEIVHKVIEDRNLTALMVTHDLHQAVTLGNRLLMFHRGEIILSLMGEEKRELTIEKLLHQFETAQNDDIISDRILFS
ncbi:ABC transporter ATP-binding protein [Vallitalea okinawensis]|uniref:ABC transporter ATP-binding protein n=1 Tax=Vallitalea okinawensis TaxID=2078660 RepID=UPI000CFCC853|nr:ATP-binding cassette domain-containing protein [Vallitalea okinawensis]